MPPPPAAAPSPTDYRPIGCGGGPHDLGGDFQAARSPFAPTATITSWPQPTGETARVNRAKNAPRAFVTTVCARWLEPPVTLTATRSRPWNPEPETLAGEAATRWS